MDIGTVKWYNSIESFGFIQPDNGGEDAFLDSGAKRKVLKRSGFERPFQARQSRLGMAS
jgi:cold shock CspA family protein